MTVEVENTVITPIAAFSSSIDSLDLAISGDVSFTDNSNGAEQWLWNFGDGNTSTIQNPQHTYTDSGVYIVSLTILNTDSCSDTFIDTIVVSGMTTSLDEPGFSDDQIFIFPVPAKDQLNIRFDLQTKQTIKIQIFDVLGREVFAVNE